MRYCRLSPLLLVLLLGAGCHSTSSAQPLSDEMRERRVREYCGYLRPDMTVADANRLFGWAASFNQGSWYWTPSRRFIVNTGHAYRIVACYDYYHFVEHYKRVDSDGVFARPLATHDDEGQPINWWSDPPDRPDEDG